MQINDSIEKFKTLLSKYQDEFYFKVVSNFLGKIPTPFQKQILNDKIIAFFNNKKHINQMLKSIDKTDSIYLNLLLFSNGLTSKDFLQLTNENESYASILNHIDNLCERLLVMVDSEKGKYVINPLFEKLLKRTIMNASILFGGAHHSDILSRSPINNNDIRAFVNYLLFPGRNLTKIFPQFNEEELNSIEKVMIPFLLTDGSLYKIDDNYFVNRYRIQKLLKNNSFQISLWAICNGYQNGIDTTICETLALLKGLGQISKENFKKIFKLFLIKSNIEISNIDFFISNLIIFRFVQIIGNNLEISSRIKENSFIALPARSNLIIDRNGDIRYYGEPEPNDILFLIAKIKTCENMVTYSISKQTYTQAREIGFSKNEIADYFSGSDILEIINQWEQDYNRVRVYEGITIKTDPVISQLIKTHPILQEHIICEISPNVFFMRTSTEKKWRSILATSIGMSSIYASKKEHTYKTNGMSLEPDYHINYLPDVDIGNKDFSFSENSDFEAELLQEAAKKKCINENTINLIKKKLIISKDQLGLNLNYNTVDKTVSGFDYKAKILLIKSVIKDSHSILKLETLDDTIICEPIELINGSNENSVIKVNILPEDKEMNISVSSIFSISAIRRSMA